MLTKQTKLSKNKMKLVKKFSGGAWNYDKKEIDEFDSNLDKNFQSVRDSLMFKNKFIPARENLKILNEKNSKKKTRIPFSTIIKDDDVAGPEGFVYSEVDSSESGEVSSDVRTIVNMLQEVQDGKLESVLGSVRKTREKDVHKKKSFKSYLENSNMD